MPALKIEAIHILSNEMANVERVSGKLLKGGMISHVFKDKGREEKMAKLKAKIDNCVEKLTLPEVPEAHTLNPRPQTPDPILSSLHRERVVLATNRSDSTASLLPIDV